MPDNLVWFRCVRGRREWKADESINKIDRGGRKMGLYYLPYKKMSDP